MWHNKYTNATNPILIRHFRGQGGKTAIIGTGIAGMGCAHFLHKGTDLTIYEQNDYVGGHTNTVTVDEEGKPVYIDTGFMVFNFETYPEPVPAV